MPKLPDGTVVPSYFKLKKQDTGKDIKDQGMRTVIGQVAKVHFVDDSTNVSKKFVEYDVVVRDESGGQTTLKNVRQESQLGGGNDYEETILEPSDVAYAGKLDASNLFANKNGTIVYVSFRDGSLDKPYIEGAVIHPKRVGAKRADGIRKLGEFRGVEWNINSDGELTITYRGNRKPNGELVRPNSGPTVIKIDKNGVFTVKTKGGASAEVNGATGLIHLKDNGTGALKIQGDKVALGASSAELLQQVSDQLQKHITMANAEATHTHLGNLGYPTAAPSTQSDWTTLASDLTAIKALVDGIKGTL